MINNKQIFYNEGKEKEFFAASIAVVLFVAYNLKINFSIIGGLFVLFVSVFQLIKVKKNNSLFLLYFIILYFNYSIVVGNYFVPRLRVLLHGIESDQIEHIYQLGLMTLIVLVTSIYCFSKKSKKNSVIKRKDNVILFYILAVVASSIVLFINEDRLTGNHFLQVVTEYNIIVVTFMCYFTGKSKARKGIALLIVILMAIKEFLKGGRIISIQCVIILFLFFYSDKLDYKQIIPICLVGIFCLNFIGQVRSGSGINFSTSIVNLFSGYFVLDTANFAYEASITHLLVLQDVNIMVRLKSFGQFIISIIFGNSIFDTSLAQLTNYAQDMYYNLGGGLLSTYWYFWLSWPGVILLGFFVAKISNWANSVNRSEYKTLACIVFISSIFRWYLYNTIQIWRISLFITGILLIIINFSKEVFSVKDVCIKRRNINLKR